MREDIWYIGMSTEGWLSYDTLLMMEDKERMHWKQKCIDRNDEIEEKTGSTRRRSGRRSGRRR